MRGGSQLQLEPTYDLAVVFCAQQLVGRMIDIFGNKLDATVAEQEVGATSVSGLKPHFCGPIVRPTTRIRGGVVASVVIDRNQSCTIAVAVIRIDPSISRMLRTFGSNLAEENCLG